MTVSLADEILEEKAIVVCTVFPTTRVSESDSKLRKSLNYLKSYMTLMQSILSKLSELFQKKNISPYQSSLGSMTCFKCQEKGHFAKYCLQSTIQGLHTPNHFPKLRGLVPY